MVGGGEYCSAGYGGGRGGCPAPGTKWHTLDLELLLDAAAESVRSSGSGVGLYRSQVSRSSRSGCSTRFLLAREAWSAEHRHPVSVNVGQGQSREPFSFGPRWIGGRGRQDSVEGRRSVRGGRRIELFLSWSSHSYAGGAVTPLECPGVGAP